MFRSIIIFNLLYLMYHTDYSLAQSCSNNEYNDKQQKVTSTCLVWGGYHVKTFDDHGYSFRFGCAMTMMAFTSGSADFRVDIGDSDKSCKENDCYTFVEILYNGERYRLGRDDSDLPFISTARGTYPVPATLSGIIASQPGSRVVLDFTEVGVVIKWDKQNMVEVSIKNDKGYQLLGLCGNNDQCSSNDQQSRTGAALSDFSSFLKEWRVSSTCSETIATQSPCRGDKAKIKKAESTCQILEEARFKEANKMLDPELYFNACVWDHCDCGDKGVNCVCETLDVYAKASVSAGVTKVSWRSPSVCKRNCQGNLLFLPCVPKGGLKTCNGVPLPVATDGKCEEGCYCSAAMYFLNQRCYTKKRCPCIFGDDILEPDGTIVQRGQVCTCKNGKIDCPEPELKCDPNAVLSPAGNKCTCKSGWTGSGTFCYDIDECKVNNGNCASDTLCINSEGSYKCVGCDPNAVLSKADKKCTCNVGWAGDGTVCGVDSDMDNWPDSQLACSGERCKKDNCQTIPNSGQEDFDKDGVGDACESDADKDGILNKYDNCPTIPNADQADKDGDDVGDACDNCPDKSNVGQEDTDSDRIGDACDDDIDEDGVLNAVDNCPNKINTDQADKDGDGIGDVCDNCPVNPNPAQEDKNDNLVGDICDSGKDTDGDGINDELDNCKDIPNTDQNDVDNDGKGDTCDDDVDDDGILNSKDNCIMVSNPSQNDNNNDGRGDACEDDFDGDGTVDGLDNCPQNHLISKTDFRQFQSVAFEINVGLPIWYINSQGNEIVQTRSHLPGVALGPQKFVNVDYEGTFFVDGNADVNQIGFVFSYQSNRKFYAVIWKKKTYGSTDIKPYYLYAKAGVQIKLVNSTTGPGEMLRYGLWYSGSVPEQATLLWEDPKEFAWEYRTSYRWKLIHRPNVGLINLKIFSGNKVVVDSGDVIDKTLKGGRLGVYAYSQRNVTWTNLEYKCSDVVPKMS